MATTLANTGRTPKAFPIERKERLSAEDFKRNYLEPNLPVIITGAMNDWQALKTWTPDFFKARFGSIEVDIDKRGTMHNLGELMDKVNQSSAANPAPYLRNNVFRKTFPQLADDIKPLPPYFTPNWLNRRFMAPRLRQTLNRGGEMEIYIGGAGAGFPVLHYDGYHTHAFLMQIHGRKKFYIYGPDQTPFLYAREKVPSLSDVNDVETPDLTKYPLFAQAVPTTFVLEPGEILFIPNGWWHTTKMLTPSISLSVNTVNRTNWGDLCTDLANSRGTMTRVAVALYLKSVFVWNSLEDIFLS